MEKTDLARLRLSPEEKSGFLEAANLAGLSLSAWMRSRLRAVCARELESAGRVIPFYKLPSAVA
jgi:hypothetical protein